MKNTTNW